jgi:hypothetical protein
MSVGKLSLVVHSGNKWGLGGLSPEIAENAMSYISKTPGMVCGMWKE